MKKSASGFECGHCGEPEKKAGDMNVCGRCHRVRYCSRACQSAHWKTGGHKKLCLPPEACKPSAQPLEDRTAEIQCLICLGSSGRVYEHTCRSRIHISCLADLFGHHTCDSLACTQNKSCNSPPCPVCRVPFPKLSVIFDQLAAKGMFAECRELNSTANYQQETDLWILFHEASYYFKKKHWDQAIELFRTFVATSSEVVAPVNPLHSAMEKEARLLITSAEKNRDLGPCQCPRCLAKPSF